MTENGKERHRTMPAERRLEISEMFANKRVVRIDELAERFDVSRETIRRDLITLEDRGVIERVHGGGIRHEIASSEPPFEERLVQQAEEKEAIARLAADLIAGAHTVFLDVGTSVARVVEFLPETFSGEVITNSILAAQMLAPRRDLSVLLTGGRLRHGDLALSGPNAVATLRDVFVEVALLGSGGVDAEHGLTDFYPEEIDSRRVVIANANRSLVMADSTKIGKIATHRVVPLERLTGVITDDGISIEHQTAISGLDIELHIAPLPESG